MKKLLLSVGMFSLAVAANAQSTQLNLRTRGAALEMKQSNGSTKQVAGSLVCNTQYTAGSTMDLSFTLNLTNTDDEYCDLLTLTFPAGITPNSSPNSPLVSPAVDPSATGTQVNPVSGQSISWGADDDANKYGGIPTGTAINFTVNVTIGANVSGDQIVNFTADGDSFGSAPGDLTGTATIAQAGTPLPNLQVLAVRPLHNVALGRTCSFTQDTVFAVIRNAGNTTESNIVVNLSVNGGSAVQATAAILATQSLTLAPGDTAYAFFLPMSDFSGIGLKNMKAWVGLQNDVVRSNDTLTQSFMNTLPTNLSSTDYVNGIESDYDFKSLWSRWSGIGTGFGTSTVTKHSGAQALFYTVNTGIGAPAGMYETFVVLPCNDVIEGEKYKISFWRKANTSGTFNINGSTGVFVGLSDDVASVTADTLKAYTAITPNAAAGLWEKDSVEWVATSCGTVYFAIGGKGEVTAAAGAVQGKGVNVRLDDILVERVATVTTVNQSACSSFIWEGTNYTQSGQFEKLLQGANCDSTVTLNLTIDLPVTAVATLDQATNVISASNGSSYQWVECPANTPISGATSATFTPTVNGSYAVIVSSGSCADTSNCVTISGLGIDNNKLELISVKPNPSNGLFTISNLNNLEGKLIITDATGRFINEVALSESMIVDITSVSQGVYYFNLVSNNSNRVIRVIKN